MDIYLIDPEGPTLHLPVNPIGEISIKREKRIETVEIINLGEVDFPTGTRITEISFSSFFPEVYDPAYCRTVDLLTPREAMQKLTTWTIKKGPIRLIITEPEINVMVLVSAHNTTIKGGEPGDIYYDLICRVYREIRVRTAAEAAAPIDTNGIVVETRTDTKPVPPSYEIKHGDTLWAIAKLIFGNGDKWQEIYDLNRDEIGPDPHTIAAGTRLVLPS